MILLHRLNPVLRGWTAYFRHGVSKATFSYLRAFVWRRVMCWLRHKHRRANWKRLRRRYLPGWWPAEGEVRLFNPGAVTVSRYRYRGARIPSPWAERARPDQRLARWHEVVESRMRGNAHVRFGGRAGETERPKGRHRAPVRPYYLKVREAGRVVSMAALVATGVAMSGERRVLGIELSAGNDEGSAWPTFIRSLVGRGLHGVRLVISDDHAGLVKAIREQLLGSGWQRCRVHLTRNAQDLVPRSARSMIASAVRSIFEQPDERSAHEQFGQVIDSPRAAFPGRRQAAARCRSGPSGPLQLP